MSDLVHLTAPAKLTWSLQVGARTSEGLHSVEAEMISLDLGDDLVVDPSGSGVAVKAEGVSIEAVPHNQENLVARALAMVGREAAVSITKRIPVGGGLGGGSSDAAAILRWAGFDNMAAAATLGSDVPFCIRGGRAMVRGVGELVEPLGHESRTVVLCLVPISVNTGLVYQAFDELERGGALQRGRNDLTQAAMLVEPRLADIARTLNYETGAEVTLAGSGSTLFLEGTKAQRGIETMATLNVGGLECRLVECVSVKSETAQ
jgi:4-diphosphocytidyl-2-C-methyl-D-erythritol kinase